MMANFSQLPFTCSQEEDSMGSEKKFSPPKQSESAFMTYIQHPSSTSTTCENNLEADGKGTEEHEDY